MNKQENTDWRTIAHDEYESRKSIELQFAKAQKEVQELRTAIEATNNYNSILAKRIKDLEYVNGVQASRLTRSVSLLKNAKLLLAKHKQQVINLEDLNKDLQEEVLRKVTLLDAETNKHQHTSTQLANALNKLTTAAALSSFNSLITVATANGQAQRDDVIYAKDDVEQTIAKDFADACARADAPPPKQTLFQKLFGLTSVVGDNSHTEEDSESEFMQQLMYFDNQVNK